MHASVQVCLLVSLVVCMYACSCICFVCAPRFLQYEELIGRCAWQLMYMYMYICKYM